MLLSLAFVLRVLLSARPASAAAPPPADLGPLLQLVAARLGGPEITTYDQTETEEDLDGDHHVTSIRMTKSIQHLLPGDRQHGDVVLGIEDGRDVTEKVREFRAKREENQHGARGEPLPVDLDFHLPFEASQLQRYTFTRSGGTAQEPVIAFAPKGDPHRLWVGHARIDAATGTLLQLDGHPAVLPFFVDQIDMHLEFDPSRPSGTLPARVVIEGSAHFLFFHKRMRYTSVTSLPTGAAAALGSLGH